MDEKLVTRMREALADYDRYAELPLGERAAQHRLPEFCGRFVALAREAVIAADVAAMTPAEIWAAAGRRFSAADMAQSKAAGDA